MHDVISAFADRHAILGERTHLGREVPAAAAAAQRGLAPPGVAGGLRRQGGDCRAIRLVAGPDGSPSYGLARQPPPRGPMRATYRAGPGCPMAIPPAHRLHLRPPCRDRASGLAEA